MRSALITLVLALVVVGFLVRAAAHHAGHAFHHTTEAFGSVAMQTSTPTIAAFHALQANGSINVELRQGATTSLTFHAKPETLAKLQAEVVDGVLTIGTRDTGWNQDLGPITATIETPNIDEVSVNGSGDVELKEVKTSKLSVSINGSADVTVSGATDTASIDINGSGNVNAERLVADAVTAKVFGSGDVHVQALKTLDASIAGSGNIQYSGKPDLHQSIAGSGSISREGE